MTENDSCSICYQAFPEEIKEQDRITFKCGHSICSMCFPYQMIHIFKTFSFKGSFLNQYQKYTCCLCEKGEIFINFDQMQKNKNEPPKEFEHNCNNYQKCNNKSSIWCIECWASYCSNCSEIVHNVKVFNNHHLEPVSIKGNICHCQNKKKFSDYCIECGLGVCKTCSEAFHKTHKKYEIEDFIKEFMKNKNCDENSQILANVSEAFNEFKKNQLENMKIALNKKNQLIDEGIEKVIDLLKRLKEEAERKANSEIEKLENHLLWIEKSFDFLRNEWEKDIPKEKIHKTVLLTKYLDFLRFSSINVKNYEINLEKEENFCKEMQEKITSFLEQTIRPFDYRNYGEFTFKQTPKKKELNCEVISYYIM